MLALAASLTSCAEKQSSLETLSEDMRHPVKEEVLRTGLDFLYEEGLDLLEQGVEARLQQEMCGDSSECEEAARAWPSTEMAKKAWEDAVVVSRYCGYDDVPAFNNVLALYYPEAFRGGMDCVDVVLSDYEAALDRRVNELERSDFVITGE